MRTRRSNRTKSYAVQKYDFESSSSETEQNVAPNPPAKPSRRRRATDDADENFDASALNESPAAVDDDMPSEGEEEAEEEDAAGSEASESGMLPPVAAAPPRRRVKKTKKHVSGAGYLDLESVTTDTHLKGYTGPFDRSMRGQTLVSTWYGPRTASIHLAQRLLDRWISWTVLPPRHVGAEHGISNVAPWAAEGYREKEAHYAEQWSARLANDGGVQTTQYRELGGDEAALYAMPTRELRLIMGPYEVQREISIEAGDSYALSQGWIPYDADDNEGKIPTGWVLDVGGIVTGMDWAPRREGEQVLALAVIPHSDQEDYDYEAEHQRPDFQKYGTVQLWGFRGDDTDGVRRPSAHVPSLRRTVCLDYGRARRVRWSPACNHLAILCGDGGVHVIEVDDKTGSFDKVEHPLASFTLKDEYSIKATAFAWATFNRLVVGYSDGSIALWSLYPSCLLSRHAVHHSLVVDIATGSPSHPFLVASTPVGGTTKLVDLTCPTYETTEVQTNAVSWQPNMLAYSSHIQGFFSVYPSANALNTMVGFLHQRFFPIVRRVYIGEGYNSCLASGKTHPFLLIGTSDGSLWCLNPQVELFTSRRELTNRLRLFQHEHRPKELFPADSAAPARGACRIVHGFAIEKGRSPKGEVKAQQGKKARRPKKAELDAGEGIEDDEAGGLMDPSRGIVYEPLSRLTVVEWNPNEGFGCWAAAAMASGLVRVLDLGLDNAG
ncbi:WD40 repeat-like-containing domain protein [Metarhizium album ARSEF 1941]|uniref:WD40 repeat-like-containing domain protein n=1 Tax=Metarhizium album (strain ARSEF 1941) TaxID=1081103 RepID=A0A0B2WRJ8_METAS|nr:WD40 repeat-like-containing domain protein [Metarhizium album ARSEF 1941]KHN96122.1 WD40 repeat-like-containing domain protein [Metarhizium album ARSEF 1941]